MDTQAFDKIKPLSSFNMDDYSIGKHTHIPISRVDHWEELINLLNSEPLKNRW